MGALSILHFVPPQFEKPLTYFSSTATDAHVIHITRHRSKFNVRYHNNVCIKLRFSKHSTLLQIFYGKQHVADMYSPWISEQKLEWERGAKDWPIWNCGAYWNIF